MTTLLCCGENFLVEKFVKESRMFVLDIKINSEEEFKNSLKFMRRLALTKEFLILKLREKSLRVGLEICCMIKNTMLE